jgi:hypothetical protein
VTATFGIPDEWQDFERRHQLLLDKVLPPLMDACNQMVSRRMESQGLHDIVVFLLGRHVPEDFTEIMLLCANGYGTAAVRLLRPMYERVVTMMYLIGNPEKAQDFVDWLLVEKRKTLNLLRDEGGDPAKYFTPEELAQIEADYDRVKARFPKRQNSWSRLDLKSMARKVGIGNMYVSLCHWPTFQVHTTLIGMMARVDATAGSVGFRVGAQREDADRALLGAHTCLLLALDSLSRHFGLPIEKGEQLVPMYKEYWDRDIPAS